MLKSTLNYNANKQCNDMYVCFYKMRCDMFIFPLFYSINRKNSTIIEKFPHTKYKTTRQNIEGISHVLMDSRPRNYL